MPSRRRFKKTINDSFGEIIQSCNIGLHSVPLMNEAQYRETLTLANEAKESLCARINTLQGDSAEERKAEWDIINADFQNRLEEVKNLYENINRR